MNVPTGPVAFGSPVAEPPLPALRRRNRGEPRLRQTVDSECHYQRSLHTRAAVASSREGEAQFADRPGGGETGAAFLRGVLAATKGYNA